LWEFARIAGEEILSTTIIVGETNPLVGGIHDRMPVMLSPEHYHRWLDTSPAQLRAMMTPYDPDLMKSYKVSWVVNSVRTTPRSALRPSVRPNEQPGVDADYAGGRQLCCGLFGFRILLNVDCAFFQIDTEVFELVGCHMLRVCYGSLLVCALAQILRQVGGRCGGLFQNLRVCFGGHFDAFGPCSTPSTQGERDVGSLSASFLFSELSALSYMSYHTDRDFL
jgi:hypothetical protein